MGCQLSNFLSAASSDLHGQNVLLGVRLLRATCVVHTPEPLGPWYATLVNIVVESTGSGRCIDFFEGRFRVALRVIVDANESNFMNCPGDVPDQHLHALKL